MRSGGVGEGRKLGAGEVVTVHWDESGDQGGGLGRALEVVEGVEALGDE